MRASFVLTAVALATLLGDCPTPAAAFKGGTTSIAFYQWPGGFTGPGGSTGPGGFTESRGFTVAGGFTGPGITSISVEQARVTQPESSVTVKGKIRQQVGDEQYVFEDGTSSILVTIPAATWSGQDITPENLVELHGEVRRSPRQVKISVAKVVKVQ